MSTLRLVALQLAGTLVLLYVVLEVWARIFPPKDQTVWPLIQNPSVGTTFKPNSRVVLSNGLDFRTEQASNDAGFLDRPLPPIAKKPGACRIAVIGDSFVEAAQVPISQKVQVLLGHMVEKQRPGVIVETMAFGFSGTGQLNQLGYLETYVRPRKPDIVALVFVSNDFANNSALLEAVRVGWDPAHAPRIFARETAAGAIELQPIDPDWMRWRLPAAGDERPWLHAWLHRASRFYRWIYAKLALQYPSLAQSMGREPTEADRTAARLKTLMDRSSANTALLAGWDPVKQPSIDAMFQSPDPLPPAFAQALRFTGYAFDVYKARSAEDGASLVVLGTHELTGKADERLRKILADRNIPFVSLVDFIAANGGKPADAQWRHDAHWSPQGHLWAAQALAAHIASTGGCPRN